MNTDPARIVIFDEKLLEEEQYWLKEFSSEFISSYLLLDYRRPSTLLYDPRIVEITFPYPLNEKLLQLSNGSLFLLYTILLSSLKICLYKYSNNNIIIVGSPARKEFDTPNALVTVDRVDDELTFRQLLLNVRETLLGAYRRQRYPFSRLIRNLGLEETSNRFPLFDVACLLQPLHGDLPTINNDITLILTQDSSTVSGQVHFNSRLFRKSTIEYFVKHWLCILSEALEDINIKIEKLSLVKKEERCRIQQQWNITQADYPEDRCIHQLFEAQVEQRSDALAIIYDNEQITYGQLNARANQLAHHLQLLGVRPETTVGICIERSVEVVVAMLGVLKAGGAYLPLDPAYPPERLAFMLIDARVDVLVIQHCLLERLPIHPDRTLCIDTAWEEIAQESHVNVSSGVRPENLAYVIYTSGSTGQPKGVLLDHRGRVNNLFDLNQRFHIGPTDRLLALSSLSFDMSVYDIFGILGAGGTIVLPTKIEEGDLACWASLMMKHAVSVWQSVPTLLEMLVSYLRTHSEAVPTFLRLVLLGGDWIPVSLPDQLASYVNGVEVVSLGGATEASIHSTIFSIEKVNSDWRSIPYGRPMINQSCYILDADLCPTAIGVPGELYIGGIGLALGYRNRPDLTAERFIPHPLASERGARLYKTGDLARFLPDGNLELLGRIDFQVKINGFRVELGEIETTLQHHPAVEEAVVLAGEYQTSDKRLVAYIVPDKQTAFTVQQLLRLEREGLLTNRSRYTLPNGMVIAHRNKGETDYLYQKIFEEQRYWDYGIALNEGDCIWDVGANIGLFTLLIRQIYPNAAIYSFEPIPLVYDILKMNTSLYGGNVRLFSSALSGEVGMGSVSDYPHLSILSGQYEDAVNEREAGKTIKTRKPLSRTANQAERDRESLDEFLIRQSVRKYFTCSLTTISTAMRENGIERIDLLKIDGGQNELDVLAGIEDDDWGKIRQLVVEVHEIDGQLEQVTVLLKSHGYEVVVDKQTFLKDLNISTIYAFQPSQNHQCPGKGIHLPKAPLKPCWTSEVTLLSDLRTYLQALLPAPMVPQMYVLLDTLPVTSNGKVDRHALPSPDIIESDGKEKHLAPRNPLEEVLVNIWGGILKVRNVGIGDHFLELGGHSLLAMQIISRVRDIFKVDLPLRTLFQAPTVTELAERITEAGQEGGVDVMKIAELVGQLSKLSDKEVQAMLAGRSGTKIT